MCIIRVCKHCKSEFSNISGRVFSNHVRWCKANPEYESKLNSYREKTLELRIKPLVEVGKICPRCNKSFIQMLTCDHVKHQKKYCSDECARSRKQTAETKVKIREKLNSYCEAHEKSLNNLVIKCEYCSKLFKTRKRNQRFCSGVCSIASRRNSELFDDYQMYKRFCKFRFALQSFPDEFDFDLIRKHGWYLPKNKGNNLHGVSRDHMISIKYGWLNQISPEIISHPANCKLLLHSDNIRKYTGSSMKLEDLVIRIETWEVKYGKFTPLPWDDVNVRSNKKMKNLCVFGKI